MRDAYIGALNMQMVTDKWISELSENLVNSYTPGYREKKFTFKTMLDGMQPGIMLRKTDQGKTMPGTEESNIYLEGTGFFVLKNPKGKNIYTRLGEFIFDDEGVYRSTDGQAVQGYILNDKGEIMNGMNPVDTDSILNSPFDGGAASIPTVNIKLWKDANGKYLGRFEEYEFKDDGILYGKSDGGKVSVPLYKVAVINFHNPQSLFQVADGQFIETAASGKPVVGRGEVRGGLIEMSNIDWDANSTFYKQAQAQKEINAKIAKTIKDNLSKALENLQ